MEIQGDIPKLFGTACRGDWKLQESFNSEWKGEIILSKSMASEIFVIDMYWVGKAKKGGVLPWKLSWRGGS